MKHLEADAPELRWANVYVARNFFPLDLLCELNHYINEQPARKQKIAIAATESFPAPIERAAEMAGSLMRGINTAITKRYEPGVQSDAYRMHLDPEELQGGLILCSLGNTATLSLFDPYIGDVSVECPINTVVAMRPDRLHKVMPPKSGVRNFLFFGHECPHILAGTVQPPIPYMDVYAGLGDLFDQ